jgi:ferredoxin
MPIRYPVYQKKNGFLIKHFDLTNFVATAIFGAIESGNEKYIKETQNNGNPPVIPCLSEAEGKIAGTGKEFIMVVRIEDTCTACGLCVDTCPEVFEMGDDMAEVIVDEVPPEHEDAVQQAADECPVEAIVVE